jgi:hypothetical protein
VAEGVEPLPRKCKILSSNSRRGREREREREREKVSNFRKDALE